MTPAVERAREFALAAHGSQKYGEHPYSFHLDAVAEIARPYGDDAMVVAYLHDTVEDTATKIEDVQRLFGPKVAACVSLLTDEPGPDRKSRKARTYAKLAQVRGETELALTVKAADRLANVRACVADRNDGLLETYRREHPTFRSAAYRAGMCEPLWLELDALIGGHGV
jgi:(p)ppGpp synthase/HD superfamily hydrolase